MNYMYVWRNGILTNYRSGIVVVVANSMEEARKIALHEYWSKEIESNMTDDPDERDESLWPWCDWLRIQRDIEKEPEIIPIPGIVYMTGGE